MSLKPGVFGPSGSFLLVLPGDAPIHHRYKPISTRLTGIGRSANKVAFANAGGHVNPLYLTLY